MGADRNLRRIARKAGNHAPGLTEALSGLQKVQALGVTAEVVSEKLQEAQGLVDELASLKGALLDALGACRDENRSMREELRRQRAVFLRLLFHNNDLLLSADSSDSFRFMVIEERYRAEYDGMLFMTWLVQFSLGQGGPRE